MRVIFMASENNTYSGAFLSLVTLIKILKREHGVDSIVVLPYKGDGYKLLEENDIDYVVIRSCNWIEKLDNKNKIAAFIKKNVEIVYNVIPTLRIASLCRKYSPDIVHINSTYSYVGCLAGKITNIPVVWHLREFMEEDQGSKIWYRKIGYSIISKADSVVTISKALERKYTKLMKNANLNTIYNGIDAKKFHYEVSDRDSTSGRGVNCICVGGLYKNKGHETIIKAVKILVDSGSRNFAVKFVGDGPYRAQLEKMVNINGLDSYIYFCGFHEDVSGYYKDADIAIMSSYSEAFGRVTIEAMMSGVFVVGSNSGATTELLNNGEYGLLYECANEEDLADKLQYSFQNIDYRNETVSRAQKYALDSFTAEKNADNIYQLYQKALNNKAAKH